MNIFILKRLQEYLMCKPMGFNPLLRGAPTPPHPEAYNAGIWGMDGSYYQGIINFQEAYDQGIRFAIFKCSEAANIVDPRFDENYEKAKAVGMRVGAYHFVRMNVDPDKQIDRFMKVIGDRSLDYFALDCETDDGKDIRTIDAVISELVLFLEKGMNVKKKLAYSRATWWDYYLPRSKLVSEIIRAWPANWGGNKPVVMADWDDWEIWQAGIVKNRFGVKGTLDFDLYNPKYWDEDQGSILPKINVRIQFPDGIGYAGELTRE